MKRNASGRPVSDALREAQRLRGAIGGLARSAKLTPEERSAIARKAGEASAAKRRAEREARRAAGEDVPEPRPRHDIAPTPDELEPYLEEIDAEDHGYTYEQRIRQARLRLKRALAESAYRALKGE